MQNMLADIENCIKAGYPYIYIITPEEERAVAAFKKLASKLSLPLYSWSSYSGFIPSIDSASDSPLAAVCQQAGEGIYFMRDFHLQMQDEVTCRQLKDLRRAITSEKKTIIVSAPRLHLPLELEKEFAVFELPLPQIDELKDIFLSVFGEVEKDKSEEFARSASGLTAEEARLVFARVLLEVENGNEPETSLVVDEKRRLVAGEQVLEFYEREFSTDDVGGMHTLKSWLSERKTAFEREARDFGLPEPKGFLLLGVQGCGKSLMAKAVAAFWKLPLVRLDLGAVFSSRRGPEETMRRATRLLEAMSPVVLWIDEIEKGFADGGEGHALGSRILGHFITWLQEKKKPVFVVATANRVESLPPELLRKGRFDEIFFVDLPSSAERREILDIHLKRRKLDSGAYDLDLLSKRTRNFSGSEIEQLVVDSLYRAYARNSKPDMEDFKKTILEAVPLYRTYEEEIKKLRDWAAERTRRASLDTSLVDHFEKVD